MAEELKVYLDHHIPRDDFLYRYANEKKRQEASQDHSKLRFRDLYGENSMDHVLRKPDFQRVTWAWTPHDCVSLLESIVNEQVIPSIIMWLSPTSRWYVLDGGHRISVVLAWLKDDWGKDCAKMYSDDQELAKKIQEASDAVESLMERAGIGKFKHYQDSYKRIESLPKEAREYEEEVNTEDARRAAFYRRIIGGLAGFPLQWVEGDFEKAERSFLKINSSGNKLTDWEIKLVENRDSSFARVVMSLSNITKAEQYWPTKVSRGESESQIKTKVEEILEGINKLHKILFDPPHDISFSRVQQPILAEPNVEPYKKPAYLAELFTIIKGGKGQPAQTERLIREDKAATASIIIAKGLQLVQESLDTFNHLKGQSSQSLALIPALYFYSENGKYVRGMLYGLLYWLFIDNREEDLLQKKLYFSAYRGAFEEVLIEKKRETFYYFGRKGSGPETITLTAEYFKKLLFLLKDHRGVITSEVFVKDYYKLFKYMSVEATRPSIGNLPYSHLPRCTVCRGFLDLSDLTEYNGLRYAHPFCKDKRDMIERILRGEQIVGFPVPTNQKKKEQHTQLSFLNFE